jgi:hypothetical protein
MASNDSGTDGTDAASSLIAKLGSQALDRAAHPITDWLTESGGTTRPVLFGNDNRSPPPHHPEDAPAAGQPYLEHGLVWPPDALTRLLMAADGVTEDALDALFRRVMTIRTSGWP